MVGVEVELGADCCRLERGSILADGEQYTSVHDKRTITNSAQYSGNGLGHGISTVVSKGAGARKVIENLHNDGFAAISRRNQFCSVLFPLLT